MNRSLNTTKMTVRPMETVLHVLTLGSLLFASMSATGCNYNDLKNPANLSRPRSEAPAGSSPDASVDFATVKRLVFEPACLKCHGETAAKAGVRLDTYAFASAASSTVRAVVSSGDMPPPPPRGSTLSAEQQSLLFAWIDSGSPETVEISDPGDVPPEQPEPPEAPVPEPLPQTPSEPMPPTAPEPQPPDFAFVSQNVFVPHCLKCHASDVKKGDVDLEIYSEAVKNSFATGAALDIDDMPRRAPPLSPELKKIVYDWIAAGTPEFVP